MNRTVVKMLLVLLKVVITVLFVIVVNRAIPIDQKSIAELIPLSLLLSVSLLSFISSLLQGYRWYFFLHLFELTPTVKQAFRSYLEGVLFGIITPGRAGELFRGFTLEPHWRKTASIAVITEKVCATIVLFLVGALAYAFLPGNRGGDLYGTGIIAAAIVSVVAIPIVPILIKRSKPTHSRINRTYLLTITLSVAIHTILLIQAIILLVPRSGLSISDAFATAASAFSAMQFMPVTVANMGVREFCFNLFGSLYMHNTANLIALKSVILSSSLIIVLANLIFPAIPGVILLISSKFSGTESRR